ncbi:MAG: LLM class flavin-dependent oxidoreductase [Deltaproteobacteria bacterium]|nr:MAG: LLM class flavin-dependent oxidoreductase [Deltaproteobacteria bacterium]
MVPTWLRRGGGTVRSARGRGRDSRGTSAGLLIHLLSTIDNGDVQRDGRAMQIGMVLRNMGPQSTRETVLACARAVDAASAIADLWVTDHIAIPPDDAEGSEGRYLDPLATLAYLAGATTRVGLGTSVLVLPYRPPLPTAKAIATVQELSGGRLLLGVGVGWMAAEFRALGVDLRRRGPLTDETLTFIDRCFADDVVEANGQPFLSRPRPPRPPIFIGGAPPHAFRRAVAHRAGGCRWVSRPSRSRRSRRSFERVRRRQGSTRRRSRSSRRCRSTTAPPRAIGSPAMPRPGPRA